MMACIMCTHNIEPLVNLSRICDTEAADCTRLGIIADDMCMYPFKCSKLSFDVLWRPHLDYSTANNCPKLRLTPTGYHNLWFSLE